MSLVREFVHRLSSSGSGITRSSTSRKLSQSNKDRPATSPATPANRATDAVSQPPMSGNNAEAGAEAGAPATAVSSRLSIAGATPPTTTTRRVSTSAQQSQGSASGLPPRPPTSSHAGSATPAAAGLHSAQQTLNPTRRVSDAGAQNGRRSSRVAAHAARAEETAAAMALLAAGNHGVAVAAGGGPAAAATATGGLFATPAAKRPSGASNEMAIMAAAVAAAQTVKEKERSEMKEQDTKADLATASATMALQDFSWCGAAVLSGVYERELAGICAIHFMVSSDIRSVEEVVSYPGLVLKLVEFLGPSHTPRLQLEAAAALTSIVASNSEHTSLVVEAGVLAPLVRLLEAPTTEPGLKDQVVWALGNIAGDTNVIRDQVIAEGAVEVVGTLLDELLAAPVQSNVSLLKNVVWLVANMCRGKPSPALPLVSPLIPRLGKLIKEVRYPTEVLADACWALNYLGDGESERIQALVDANVCQKLVELLAHVSRTVVVPALRALGNLVTGSEEHTEHVLSFGILPALVPLLRERQDLRGQACWTLSNVTAGPSSHIQRVIDAGLIPHVVGCSEDPSLYVTKEAIWAISNASQGGSTEQVALMAREGCLAALVRALDREGALDSLRSRVIVLAIDAVGNMLAVGDVLDPDNNTFLTTLRECRGDVLLKEKLRHHADELVRLRATELIERFVDYQSSSVSIPKPAPELWTPEEVAEEKARLKALELSRLNEEEKVIGTPPPARRTSFAAPPQFYCPISQELMVDPVSTVDGHVYDRANIQKWLRVKLIAPVSGSPLTSNVLVPNHPLRQMIEAFKPGHTHRADLDSEWSCVACTSLNEPTDTMCMVCGAEKPPRKPQVDPDAKLGGATR